MGKTTQSLFEAVIQKEGAFTFVSLPITPHDAWGAKPPYRVTGTINGIPVRGTLGALGHDYFLRLSAKWMKSSGLEVGAKVTVELSLEGPGGNQDRN